MTERFVNYDARFLYMIVNDELWVSTEYTASSILAMISSILGLIAFAWEYCAMHFEGQGLVGGMSKLSLDEGSRDELHWFMKLYNPYRDTQEQMQECLLEVSTKLARLENHVNGKDVQEFTTNI